MEPSRRYRSIVRTLRAVLFRWFRTVEVTGQEHVDVEVGGVLVAWHPNGLLDPALILATCPRVVVFGARHGLFRVPLLGWIMRGLGVRPIVRAADVPGLSSEERRRQNDAALEELARAVADGGFACLFPEGDSHDEPHLLPLKTGAARLFLQAGRSGRPVIIPVGLHYDHKWSFRGHALVAYHPPLELPPELDGRNGSDAHDEDDARERARAITREIEASLHRVVNATESWELHHLMHRSRALIRAERAHRAGSELDRPTMEERTLGFARVWDGYHRALAGHPDQVAALIDRVREYDADMRALRLRDHDLDRPPRLRGQALLLLQVAAVFFLAPPLLLVGLVVNAPAVAAMWVAGKRLARLRKDEASIKVLVAAVLLPVSWVLAGALAWHSHEWLEAAVPGLPDRRGLAAAATVGLGIAGGALAIRYFNVARETARAVRVRITRGRRLRSIAALRRERGRLCDALLALAEGAVLPGRVAPDGRVVRD